MIYESGQVAQFFPHQDLSFLGLFAIGTALIVMMGLSIIFNLFFVLSIRKTLKMIPKKDHVFPMVLLWLMIVPGVGYVFEWIMLPFGVPRAIESFFMGSEQSAQRNHSRFFGLGLAAVILEMGIFTAFFGIVSLILKIIYWSYAVSLRHQIQIQINNSRQT